MLGFVYIILALWQTVWLVLAVKNKRGWIKLLILSALSTVLAFGCMWYFDTLPGYGIMPGWAYFAEVFYSLCAGIVYLLVSTVALLCTVFYKK